jgi:4-hydroxy-2-oxoheptanedioate aldolase
MTADEARTIVAACKYPPAGNRSIGGGLHSLNYGCTAERYFQGADDQNLVIIQTEHIKAVEVADQIYSVPGLDAVFVGPNDLAWSMRTTDGVLPSKQQMEDTLGRILAAAKRNGLPCGLHVQTAADALRRAKEGWQFIAVASELKFMLEGAAALVNATDPERAKGELAKY